MQKSTVCNFDLIGTKYYEQFSQVKKRQIEWHATTKSEAIK